MTNGCIFSKNMHLKDADIIFFVFINQLELTNSVNFRMLILPCKMYKNNIIFSINENVMHHFRKSKILFISLKFAFSSVQTVYGFIIKYIVPLTYLPPQIYFLT